MEYVRELDNLEPSHSGTPPLDATSFQGAWLNTNPECQGIAKVLFTPEEGTIRLRVVGTDGTDFYDWGDTTLDTLYALSNQSTTGAAFTASFDLGFKKVHLEGNLNLGLFVIAGFHEFQDGSGRSNYFSREFFIKLEG